MHEPVASNLQHLHPELRFGRSPTARTILLAEPRCLWLSLAQAIAFPAFRPARGGPHQIGNPDPSLFRPILLQAPGRLPG